MKTNAIIQEEILFFLYQDKYFNKRHAPISNICNKLSGIPCKYIKNELKSLYKLKFIRFKKTKHGNDVFLNIKMKKEIEDIQIKWIHYIRYDLILGRAIYSN